jgi:hypothetical protein
MIVKRRPRTFTACPRCGLDRPLVAAMRGWPYSLVCGPCDARLSKARQYGEQRKARQLEAQHV